MHACASSGGTWAACRPPSPFGGSGGRDRVAAAAGTGTRTGRGDAALVLLLLALLELGEEGLVLLVQLLRLPPRSRSFSCIMSRFSRHRLLFTRSISDLPAASLRSSCEPRCKKEQRTYIISREQNENKKRGLEAGRRICNASSTFLSLHAGTSVPH
jgi:hypothetical protein